MTTGDDEVPDYLLVAVDDEVSAEGGGFFAVLDQVRRGEAADVTSYRLGTISLACEGGTGWTHPDHHWQQAALLGLFVLPHVAIIAGDRPSDIQR